MQNPLNTNIKTPAFNWLQSQNSEFAASLQQLDIDAISDFTLVWSYFENKVLGTKASCEKISEVTKSWQSNKHLEISKFETNLNYFKNRYFKVGGFKSKCNTFSLMYSVRLDLKARQPLPINLKRCSPAQRFSRPTIHKISDFI
jgi:hypothetical protein